MTEPAPAKLSRHVKALGVVSLLGDVASEMIYPLLPLFLTTVLGASATMIGTIEGLADSTSSLLKLASGWWADRVPRKKPLVIGGYLLSAIARPVLAIAAVPWHALAVRMTDRTGKGIRTSPRDALLADSSDASSRGRAFGFHRALDNVGAVVGPLLAWLLYEIAHMPMRSVFLWTAVPGALSIVVLVLFVRETPKAAALREAVRGTAMKSAAATVSLPGGVPLGSTFWRYLAVLFVFTLGASSDAFLLVRAQQVGVPMAVIPILYAALNLVKALSSTPGGALSDRYGRRPLMIIGWALYALVYLGFGMAAAPWQIWGLFLVYGLYFGLTEGAEKALVADLVPAERRGTAFGWFNFSIGIAALPASLLFGLVWDRVGPSAAFSMGAALASAATVGLIILVPRSARAAN
ncbi:MAG: MFS transporter [Gemmatimonadetes bacterium]|nr:MFS transporter [Gemmatimonadota bacterium]